MCNQQPETLTIYNLLNNNQYIVPIYQRNYAWTNAEIKQLLYDINSKATDTTTSKYYLGTLITSAAGNNGTIPIIDGQQRYTTLSLINAVLYKSFNTGKVNYPIPGCNLTFETGRLTGQYINSFYEKTEPLPDSEKNIVDSSSITNIKSAVTVITEYIKDHIKEIDTFIEYFYNQVMIIKVEVPPNTDVNHYFEIMNTRGEQLEKHEILKSWFIEKTEIKFRDNFSVIWDSCSQMDSYVITNFNQTIISDILNKGLTCNVYENNNSNTNEVEPITIATILTDLTTDNKETFEQPTIDKYKSIIDFPTFLMFVLKTINNNTPLDDKKLLEVEGYRQDSLLDPTDFIKRLLYYRVLFDKYVIKREVSQDNDWKWWLYRKDNNENIDTVFTNGQAATDKNNEKQLIMMQSMLHVSMTTYNETDNWLYNTLKYLGEQSTPNNINITDYIQFTDNIIKKEVKNQITKASNNDMHKPRILFYGLDYLLWKKYRDNGLEEKYKKYTDKIKNFQFSQNNSVEHIKPQKYEHELIPNDTYKNTKDILNNFGNLCLISSSSNSKYSDYNFEAKKEQFDKKKSIESLKLVEVYIHNEWGTTQITEHGDNMIKLLKNYTD